MKFIKKLIFYVLALASVFGVSSVAFADTAMPTVTSVGNVSGYVNLLGSANVPIAGTFAASTTALTVVTVTYSDSLGVSVTSSSAFAGGVYLLNSNLSALVDGNVDVSVTAKTGDDIVSAPRIVHIIKDIIKPSFTEVTMVSSNTNASVAVVGDTVTIHATSSENLASNVSATMFGRTASVSGSGRVWTATTIASSNDAAGSVAFTLNFSDAAGNQGNQVSSVTSGTTVSFSKTGSASITLYGSNPVNITLGSVYVDAGATAVASNGTNISSSISTTNNVNANVAGTYTVTYTVTDPVTGVVSSATRIVVVGTVSGNVYGNTGVTTTGTVSAVTSNGVYLPTASGQIIFVPNTAGTLNAQTVHNAIISNLTLGSRGDEVVTLQTELVAEGHLVMPAGVALGYFGQLTMNAVIRWQKANGITPALGYFGPKSRAVFNALISSNPNANLNANVNSNANASLGTMTLKQLLQLLIQSGAIPAEKLNAAIQLEASLQ